MSTRTNVDSASPRSLLRPLRACPFDVLGRDQLIDVRAEELLARVAAGALAGDVHRGDAAFEVVRVDEIVRILEQLAIPLLAPPQLFLGTFALGDVLRDDQPHAAAAGEELERRDFDVDHRAVLPAMAEVARAATFVEIVERSAHRRDLFRRTDVGDREAEELVAREAVVCDGGVVDGGEAQRLEIVHPHRQRVHLEERAIAMLALAQRLLGAFALREIAGDIDDAERHALVVAQEGRRREHVDARRLPRCTRPSDARARPCCSGAGRSLRLSSRCRISRRWRSCNSCGL
jgi:hypothetical protein